MFEIVTSVKHYTYAVRSHQPTTLTKLAAHTIYMRADISVCRSATIWGEPLDHIDYGGHEMIPTNHLWWANTINNIFQDTPEDILFCPAPRRSKKI